MALFWLHSIACVGRRAKDRHAESAPGRWFGLFRIEFLEIFFGQRLLNFGVSWDCLNDSVLGVHPERMASSFSLEKATSDAKATLQIPALHPTEIFS
jgi:hypothetical protein